MTLKELKKYFENDKFAMDVGCEILTAGDGQAVVTLDVCEKHFNGVGIVQGGVVFTLADFACAVAANSEESTFVSADGTISYLNAAVGKRLVASAKVVKDGKTLAFCEATITNDDDKLVAKASFTMCRIK